MGKIILYFYTLSKKYKLKCVDHLQDVYTADPESGNVDNGDNGQVACDSYHKYKEDVQLLKNMGASAYRFSIAWTRILPQGIGEINQKGIDYYNRKASINVTLCLSPLLINITYILPLFYTIFS